MQWTLAFAADQAVDQREILASRHVSHAAFRVSENKYVIQVQHHPPRGVISMPVAIAESRLRTVVEEIAEDFSESSPGEKGILSNTPVAPQQVVRENALGSVVPS